VTIPRNYALVFFAVLAAVASVLCVRSGFLSFFFLLPLGVIAFFCGAKTAWGTGILAVAINTIIALWFYLYGRVDPDFLQWNVMYFTVMALVFTWINVPLGKLWAALETPYRLVIGAVCCVLLLMPLFLFVMDIPQQRALIVAQLEALRTIPVSEASDIPDAEVIFSATLYAALRGGFLVSCMLFLWVNRQLASLLVRMVRRFRGSGGALSAGTILSFHVKPVFIWLLSFALGAILLGKIREMEMVEIGGWNVLIFCAILFLVQGGAVALYFLAKLPPLPRILVAVGIIMMIFRPGLNVAFVVLLVLLGIVENWIPFRVAPKQ